jgi:glycine betaine/proline transport system substrate-binding protein
MSYAIQVERQDPYEFAKQWVARNEARVKEWTDLSRKAQ